MGGKKFRLKEFTVRAEIITELILERAGPVILKAFLLEVVTFRLLPIICPTVCAFSVPDGFSHCIPVLFSQLGFWEQTVANWSALFALSHFCLGFGFLGVHSLSLERETSTTY